MAAKKGPVAKKQKRMTMSSPLPSLTSSIIVEILSYLVGDYRDLARIRSQILNKTFHEECFPSILSRSNFLKCCYGTSSDFFQQLCDIGEFESRGEVIDLAPLNAHLADYKYLKLHSLRIIKEYSEYQDEMETKLKDEEYRTVNDDLCKSSICHRLCETTSLKEFENLKKEALECGLFLPDSITSYGTEEDNTFHTVYSGVVILVLSYSHDDDDYESSSPVDVVAQDGDIIHLSHVKNIISDIKALKLRECDSNLSFRGFVKGGLVRVPLILGYERWNGPIYDMNCVDLLPVSEIMNRHQYQLTVPEGVAIVDGLVESKLHNKLMDQIDKLAATQEVDYHPHSNNVVRDLVHPALFSYVKDVSPEVKKKDEVPPCLFESDDDDEMEGDKNGESDYWGRKYEASAKYQWLPTYFDIDDEGKCTICDDINNLVPRSDHAELYKSLEQLFAKALPQLESVYSYGRILRKRLRRDTDVLEYKPEIKDPSKLEEKFCSLKGQRLQVVTKIVDYELGPGESYEGVWHVEGMSHEEIVATAIYFLHRDDDIEGGNIMFKRAFHRHEANYIYSFANQIRPIYLNNVIQDSLLPLGQVETRARRLLVFPNSHVHKVRKITNVSEINDSGKKQKRRIIVFFLINPEKRIVSTREVNPQQDSMKRDDAFKHRLELMKERKFTKQDWNVREIELCEH